MRPLIITRRTRIVFWLLTIGATVWVWPTLIADFKFAGVDALEVYVLTLWGAGFVWEMGHYIAGRIRVQKKDGKTFAEIAADGAKPFTGNVWLDAAILGGLFLAAFAGFAYMASHLK